MLLSNSCLVLPAVVKQQQEEISRNHVQSLFAVSVLFCHRILNGSQDNLKLIIERITSGDILSINRCTLEETLLHTWSRYLYSAHEDPMLLLVSQNVSCPQLLSLIIITAAYVMHAWNDT